MKLFNLVFIMGFSILIGCQDVEKFQRKNELIRFLSDEYRVNLSNKNNIIILMSGTCGSCDKESLDIIRYLDNDSLYSDYNKFIIVPKRHAKIFEGSQLQNSYLNNVEDFKLDKYGLNFDKNVILVINSDLKIDYWEWLYMDKIYDVKQFLGIPIQ